MDEKNTNRAMLQEILDQIKEHNNRITKLEKLLQEQSFVYPETEEEIAASPSQKPQPSFWETKPIEPVEPRVEKERITPAPAQYKRVESKPFDWQWAELMLGKYALQIVSVIVFLLGMGFLLKYSIQKGWLTPLFRVAMGLVAATGFLVGAEVWRQKFKGWANALMAGGIVLYYFSFYAAHNFYGLISINSAFFSFFAVTVLAGIIALARDSLLIGAFSLFGGYLTPLFLTSLWSMKADAHVLAVYLGILSVGFFFISYIKQWFVLPTISFVFLMFYYITVLQSLTFNQIMAFLVMVGVVYTLMPYLYALIYKPKQRFVESGLILLSGSFLFFALYEHLADYSVFGKSSFEIFKYLLMSFGTVYLIKYMVLYVKDKTNKYLLTTLSGLFSLCYAVLIMNHFHSFNAIIGMILLGLSLFSSGLLLSAFYLRIYAYIVWLYAIIRLVPHYADPIDPAFRIFNSLNACIVLSFCSFVAAVYIAFLYKDRLTEQEKNVPELLAGAGLTIPFYWFHTNVWPSPYHIVAIMCYALMLFVIGIFRNEKLRSFAYAFWAAGVAHFGISYYTKNLLHPDNAVQLHLLYLLFISIFVIAYYCIHCFEKQFKFNEKSLLLKVLDMAIGLLGLSWGRSALILHYAEFGPIAPKNVWGRSLTYSNTLNVALTIFYGLYAFILIIIGLLKQKFVLRYVGLALIALTLGKLWFIIMAMGDTLYRIFTFIGIGLLFLVISIAYQQLSKRFTKVD